MELLWTVVSYLLKNVKYGIEHDVDSAYGRAGELDFKVGKGQGTLESIVGHHGWLRRKLFEF